MLQAEAWGYDAAWSAEWLSNPFMPLSIAAKEAPCGFTLGTMAAYALGRSPMISAQIAWDLARQTRGRFVLGLDADAPEFMDFGGDDQASVAIGKIREYLESMRAIWRSFQYDERLRYRGQHYQFRLMAPFFNPGPIADPEIPIFLTGDGEEVYALAGELCQGLHAKALHSRSYLLDVVIPNLTRGLECSGRSRESFELAVPALVLTPDLLERDIDSRDDAGRGIACYALTRINRAFARYHGWEELLDTLRRRARSVEGDAIWRSLPEEFLHEIAIVAEPERAADALRHRYCGLVDRVCLVFAVWHPETIAAIVADLKQ